MTDMPRFREPDAKDDLQSCAGCDRDVLPEKMDSSGFCDECNPDGDEEETMSDQIEISYEAKTLAKAIYYAYSSASPANIGILIQQLLNAETEKLRNQVHECGAMLQQRNSEIEKLKAKVACLLEFARHSPTCPMPARQCDCGLDEIKKNEA